MEPDEKQQVETKTKIRVSSDLFKFVPFQYPDIFDSIN